MHNQLTKERLAKTAAPQRTVPTPSRDIRVKPFNLSRFTSRENPRMPNGDPCRLTMWGSED